ncbi:hypothetical protein C8A03DRAFT_35052 [Achaetomium macrosporum]|uniref:Uncharacterized protein n=1 Tax=Achaetomium macrosporum TaxID=79813 RepID=A0AAN7C7S1_9PEZI|nr:hypothetical protein C8A03DRAFT_35052 [Achaetomium macrosporum]
MANNNQEPSAKTQLFSSTRFSFGKRHTRDLRIVRIKPGPNGLALLRACRRTNLEIGDSWLRHVLFCFEHPVDMLDKLSALPADILSRIRHVRVGSADLVFTAPGDAGVDPVHPLLSLYPVYPLASALKLLPGLRLDQLTVLGHPRDSCDGDGMRYYDRLNGLIEHGNGWKTLRYICHTSALLGFKVQLHPWESSPEFCRDPQPKHWQAVMQGRDGIGSSASVTVYRAQEPAVYGSILDPSKRVSFEQKPHEGEDLPPGVLRPEDPELRTGDEQKKEIMVIVKRGSGVDYEEKKDSPFLKDDIRRDFPGMTWRQLQEFSPVCNETLPCGTYKVPYAVQVDAYKDVDEYAWFQYY